MDAVAQLPAFQLISKIHKPIIAILTESCILMNFLLHVCSVVSGFLVSCEGIICVNNIFMHYVILAGAAQEAERKHSQMQMSLCIRKPRNKTSGISQM